jgi:cyclin B
MSETLFLAVHVLDRYMEKTRDIARDRYQLIGVAAMLVAAKYEEIFFPEINDLYASFIC